MYTLSLFSALPVLTILPGLRQDRHLVPDVEQIVESLDLLDAHGNAAVGPRNIWTWPMEANLADFERLIVPGITHWNHPRFFAYFAITASAHSCKRVIESVIAPP